MLVLKAFVLLSSKGMNLEVILFLNAEMTARIDILKRV